MGKRKISGRKQNLNTDVQTPKKPKASKRDESAQKLDAVEDQQDHDEPTQQINPFDREGMVDLFQDFLKHLSWKDRLNVRLVCWSLYNKVTTFDKSFDFWHVDLNTEDGSFPQLPSYFYDSQNEVSLTFPKVGEVRSRQSKTYWNKLQNLLETVQPRIKGFDINIEDFDKLHQYFDLSSIKIVKLRYGFDSSIQDGEVSRFIMHLIGEVRYNLEELELENFLLEDETDKIEHELPNLKVVSFDYCSSSTLLASILNQTCSLQNLSVNGEDISYLDNVDKDLEHVDTLVIDSEYSGVKNFLSKCPSLVNLEVNNNNLDELQLSGTEFSSLKALKMFNVTCSSSDLIKTMFTNMSSKLEVLELENSDIQLDKQFQADFDKLTDICLNLPHDFSNIIKMAPNLQKVGLRAAAIETTLPLLEDYKLTKISVYSDVLAEQALFSSGASELLYSQADTLREVCLFNVELDETDIQPLSKVKCLYLADCRGKLDSLLKSCLDIEHLEVDHCNIKIQSPNLSLPGLTSVNLKGMTAKQKQQLKSKLMKPK